MLPGLTPYKIDIQQGNYVTEDMLVKVKPGMSKAQVRFALGTPLIVDPFHSDRWDYVYELKKRGRVIEHRRMVAVFSDDKLVRIDGNVAPAMPGTTVIPDPLATAPAAPSAKPVATETPVAPTPPVSGTPIEPGPGAPSAVAGDKPPAK